MDSLSQNLYFTQLFALHDLLTLITCSFTSIISGIYLSVQNKQLTYNHQKVLIFIGQWKFQCEFFFEFIQVYCTAIGQVHVVCNVFTLVASQIFKTKIDRLLNRLSLALKYWSVRYSNNQRVYVAIYDINFSELPEHFMARPTCRYQFRTTVLSISTML